MTKKNPVNTDALTNPTVKAAIDALQKGDRDAWSALFEPDAKLYDDGAPRSFEKFTQDALGHERSSRSTVSRTTVSTWSVHFIRISGATFARTSGFGSLPPARSSASTSDRRNRLDAYRAFRQQ